MYTEAGEVLCLASAFGVARPTAHWTGLEGWNLSWDSGGTRILVGGSALIYNIHWGNSFRELLQFIGGNKGYLHL